MEPAGLALAVFASCKEVYLLARFILRTIHDHKHADFQKQALFRDFEYEVLFVKTLGVLLCKIREFMGEPIFESEWIEHIRDILERLRQACGDYSKLAAETDPEYKLHSPFIHPTMGLGKITSFDIPQQLEQNPYTGASPKSMVRTGSLLSWWPQTQSVDRMVSSWRWAVSERRRLESIVLKFQKNDRKLKEILPLMIVALQMKNKAPEAETFKKLIDHDSSDQLGLASHARLQQLIASPNVDTSALDLGNLEVEATQDTLAPVMGLISKSNWRGTTKEKVLVEFKEFEPCNDPSIMAERTRRVQQLANLLSSYRGSDLQTLHPQGYIHQETLHRFAFIFDFPPHVIHDTPVTLNDLLVSDTSSSRLTLPQRFRVAETLAKTLGAFHADGWVHKSMRSHSILFFRDTQTEETSVNKPYLANFEFSRPETAETNFTYDSDLEKNLYRHPDRQGPPKTSFSKLHDIYALGVVLLEIGLWQSAMSIYEEVGKKLKPGVKPNSRGVQKIFIHIAGRQLALHMGPAYRDAVLACLSDEFKDLTSRASFPRLFYEKIIQGVNGGSLFK